mmetsp:Transcript_23893/g.74698  ORF Transcript_23893/g.74698 Transcript_23893/m.74698 type:complete len:338 (+) Transcript_23893:1574-2587(+)
MCRPFSAATAPPSTWWAWRASSSVAPSPAWPVTSSAPRSATTARCASSSWTCRPRTASSLRPARCSAGCAGSWAPAASRCSSRPPRPTWRLGFAVTTVPVGHHPPASPLRPPPPAPQSRTHPRHGPGRCEPASTGRPKRRSSFVRTRCWRSAPRRRPAGRRWPPWGGPVPWPAVCLPVHRPTRRPSQPGAKPHRPPTPPRAPAAPGMRASETTRAQRAMRNGRLERHTVRGPARWPARWRVGWAARWAAASAGRRRAPSAGATPAATAATSPAAAAPRHCLRTSGHTRSTRAARPRCRSPRRCSRRACLGRRLPRWAPRRRCGLGSCSLPKASSAAR